MTENVKSPPKFNGFNFSISKAKMTIFLQSLGSRVAKAITKSFVTPEGDKDTKPDVTIKKFEANAKTHYTLLQALNDDDISRS